MTISDGLIVISTVVIALSAVATLIYSASSYAAAKDSSQKMQAVADNLNWLFGAMETHSVLLIRLMAGDRKIKVTWWDPDIEGWPFEGAHGKRAKRIQEIRIGMPRKNRKNARQHGTDT